MKVKENFKNFSELGKRKQGTKENITKFNGTIINKYEIIKAQKASKIERDLIRREKNQVKKKKYALSFQSIREELESCILDNIINGSLMHKILKQA